MSIMLSEIEEQPAALERTLRREQVKARRFRAVCEQRKFRLVVLIARGTSDNAALFGRYLIEITAGIPVSLCAPSVHTLYHASLRLDDALVVGISQSGESSDINMVMESCRKRGAYALGITNEPRSSMVRVVDECWFVHAGKERSVAATKTFTGSSCRFTCWRGRWAGASTSRNWPAYPITPPPRSRCAGRWRRWWSVTATCGRPSLSAAG